MCATFVAHFSVSVSAAVPIEESTEETRVNEPQARPLTRQSTTQQRLPEPTRQANNLDIPPTIEPSVPSRTLLRTTTSTTIDTQPSGATAARVSNTGNLSGLFRQMQILQQEVQELRGLVEVQDHQIKRLQHNQKEQYLDLDRRVIAAASGEPAPALSARPTDGSPVLTASGNLSERDAYRLAFDGMRAQQFDQSLVAFQSLIENYPNGQYTPNAFYWIGEIFLVGKHDAELARQSFMQVVNLYPDHQKASDAMYKLGVVYNTLGDDASARRFLDQVQREHANSSAAGLAEKFAAELP